MTDDIHETPSSTPNFQSELAAQLAELIPEAVADGKIDVTKLQELLSTDAADPTERFGLFWPGKKRALRAAQEPTTATLRPDFENSKDWDTTKNVFIEGDNLEVLKILQKHYHNKVKLIYIDPPYNTGKDFVYPDNYKEGLDTYLEWTRQVNEEGKKVSTNADTEGRYHSNWLNMMYPRLKLARNLLTSDGTLVVSIDDNELPRLTMMMQEVFAGEEVKTIAVKMSEASGVKMASVVAGGRLPKLKEYLVMVKRGGIRGIHMERVPKGSWDSEYKTLLANATQEQMEEARRIRDDSARTTADLARLGSIVGGWTTQSLAAYFRERGIPRAEQDAFRIENAWRIVQIASLTGGTLEKVVKARESFETAPRFFPFVTATGKVYIIDGEFSLDSTRPRCQVIFADENLTVHPGDFWGDIKTTGLDREGGVDFKNGKKPLRLLERIISTVPEKDFIVLDFFAGSATTGEAVVRLNASDGGTRKYLLVQLPEPVDDGGTVSSISRRRLESIAGRVDAIDGLDVGFRAFSLTDTLFTKWRVTSDADVTTLEQHLLDLRDSTSADDATADNLLIEIMLKQGYGLTERFASTKIDGLELRSVLDVDGDVAVLAYLDEHKKPSVDQLRAIVATQPTKLLILEDAFQGDDELKTNLVQLARSKNVELWTA